MQDMKLVNNGIRVAYALGSRFVISSVSVISLFGLARLCQWPRSRTVNTQGQ